MLYHVDIGSYRRGRCVPIEAESLQDVLSKAYDLCESEEEDVVQVFQGRRIIWDFMNGDLTR